MDRCGRRRAPPDPGARGGRRLRLARGARDPHRAPTGAAGTTRSRSVSDAGRVAHEAVACFVVRAAAPDPDRPLLALCTNTYNAYNDVGGRNLYEGGTQVSFLRPLAKGLLRKPDGPGSRVTVLDPPDPGMRAHVGYLRAHQFTQWGGSTGWPNYELPFVRWAERNGYAARLRGQRRSRGSRDARRPARVPVGRARRVLVGSDARHRRVVHPRRRQRAVPVGQHRVLAGPAHRRRHRDDRVQGPLRARPRVTGPPSSTGSRRCGPTTSSAGPRTR